MLINNSFSRLDIKKILLENLNSITGSQAEQESQIIISYSSKSENYLDIKNSEIDQELINKILNKRLKGNIGFEAIYENGITFSINYEKITHKDRERSYSHQDTILFKFGRINKNDAEFVMNFNPNQNNKTELSYTKRFNNFNLKMDTNYSLFSKIPEYGANLQISGTF